MSASIDPAKLKVVELRAELASRGLDTKGNKAVLVKRLQDALDEETGEEGGETSVVDTSTTEDASRRSPSPEEQREPSPQQSSSPDRSDEYEVTQARADDSDNEKMEVDEPKQQPQPVKEPEHPLKQMSPPPSKQIPSEPEKIEDEMEDEEQGDEPENDVLEAEENGESVQSEESKSNRKSRWGAETEESVTSAPPTEDNTENKISAIETIGTESRGEKRRRSASKSPDRNTKHRTKSPIREDEPEINADEIHLSWVDSDLHLQIDKASFLSAKPFHEGAFGWMWAGARASHGVNSGKVCFEVKITEECQWDDAPKAVEPAPKPSIQKPVEEADKKEENGTASEKEEKSGEEESAEKEEEPVEEKKEDSEDAEEEKEKTPEEEAAPPPPKPVTHLLRVGWSTSNSSLQLGESKYSYGFESTGQTIKEYEFQCYGTTFGVGDVVGCYLDLESDPATITYTVNGVSQDVAFSLPHSEFPENGLTLFPHVLTRNYGFEVNFGSHEESFAEQPASLNDYVFLTNAEEKVAGPARPDERKSCEVILMCGLPASGKTHWVQEHLSKNPDKRYTILGNAQLIERMTVNGKPLKESWPGKWTVLLDKCSKCINKLHDLAGQRRRNYILDQTNVFSSAQRRKLRPFEGFHRRAVVVVVADEEQATREHAHQEADGKDVPDTTVLEMKANMSLPTTGDWLDEVVWAELGEEEAKKIIQKYNQQGRAAGYGQHQRRNNRDNRSHWQNRNNNRRDYRDNRINRNQRWGNPRQGGGGGGGGGGWNNHRSGGPRRDNRGGSNRDWRHNGGGGRHGGGGAGGGYSNRNHGAVSSYNRGQRNPSHRSQGGSWNQGGGGNWSGNQGNWSGGNQGWGGQGGWQGSSSGSGSSWQGQGQGSQGQWKGYGSGGQQGYQGYTQGYQNYPNWSYYGQYAQNWGSQGQSQSGSTDNSSNQYQYTPQQQAAWAQYAQQGYGGYSATSTATSTNNTTVNK